MKKTLNIIVPIYNVEQYLEKCINSLIDEKNISEYEIILINDGSTDSSGKIAKKLEKMYSNVKYYEKENGGLSDARNFGIEKANAKYVWFIDSDDFLENGAIEKIISVLKADSDLIVCNSKTIDDDGLIDDECKYTIQPGLYNKQDYLDALLNNPKSVIFCAQYHICKLDLIKDNNLYFMKGIIHEDELWTPQIILNSNSINYTGLNVYYHYMRKNSIMHASKIERSGECDYIVSNLLFQIFDKYSNLKLDYLYDRAVNIYLQSVWKIKKQESVKFSKKIYLFKKSYYFNTKMKSLLYLLSTKVYLFVHKISKRK